MKPKLSLATRRRHERAARLKAVGFPFWHPDRGCPLQKKTPTRAANQDQSRAQREPGPRFEASARARKPLQSAARGGGGALRTESESVLRWWKARAPKRKPGSSAVVLSPSIPSGAPSPRSLRRLGGRDGGGGGGRQQPLREEGPSNNGRARPASEEASAQRPLAPRGSAALRPAAFARRWGGRRRRPSAPGFALGARPPICIHRGRPRFDPVLGSAALMPPRRPTVKRENHPSLGLHPRNGRP